ncbi:MAG TPA: type II toxin-antitoxin system HicB family antitoxin [bacterium]|nr:type II toxin-antitoxin system HicB family antitoxin [bacterium]HPR87692.1 type II toxin-antitoxin system HicB family antitoxin [bacterium]
MLKYKGYTGRVEFDNEAKLFQGEIIDTRDVITFQSTSVDEIEQAFRESINDYWEFCQVRGEKTDKPFSGKFVLRVPADLHHKLYVQARKSGKNINTWLVDVIKDAVE